jgi:putative SOS response-associated peptidase YedK
MCGRYLLRDARKAAKAMGVDVNELFFDEFDIKPRFNIAPTQKILTMPSMGRLAGMRWGLIPTWAQGKSSILINARSETIREKHSFMKSFAQRRCLVPADGFYEWTRATKRPHLFTLRDDEPFAIGGFWDEPREEKIKDRVETIARCCLVTTWGNAVLAPIHDRMPVIVRKEDWEQWLEPGELEDPVFARLTAPYSADEMQGVEVTPVVNSAREDSERCVEKVTDAATGSLFSQD